MSAIALVQTKSGNVGSDWVSSATSVFTSDIVAGNIIILILATTNSGNINSVSDNLGNIYAKIEGGSVAFTEVEVWYAKVTTGGACTITITLDEDNISIIAREYSGINATSPVDVYNKNVETGYLITHPTGTTGITSNANSLAIAAYGGNGICSDYAVDGYNNLLQMNGSAGYNSLVTADKILTTVGAKTVNITSGAVYTKGVGIIVVLTGEDIPETVVVDESWGYLDNLALPAPSSFNEKIDITGGILQSLGGGLKRNMKNIKKIWTLGYDLLNDNSFSLIYEKITDTYPEKFNFNDNYISFTINNVKLGVINKKVIVQLSERNFIKGTDILSSVSLIITEC